MSNEFLDAFGKLLITQVRDYTIADWDEYLDGVQKSAAGPEVNAAIARMSDKERASIKTILPGIVDSVLHNMLFLLESDETLTLTVSTDNGTSESIAEVSDGLAGELPTADGWIARFSSERHYESR
ncbi:MAG: hypothetical protein ACF8MJ_02540 [Phycisphaerales bacterium JB050]